MKFEEKIAQLQLVYRHQHDLSNKISGASFAEERGHLDEEGKKELEVMIIQYNKLEEEQITLRDQIKNNFSKEYDLHLSSIQKKLTTIQDYLNGLSKEIEFKHSFNKTITKSLLGNLKNHIQGKKIDSTLPWLFDVASTIIEEYRVTLKLS